MIKRLISQIVPSELLQQYHHALAILSSWWFGRPARHLMVVGVTGTDGKTTTAALMAAIITAAGRRAGLSSSVWFQIGSRRWRNDTHQTMPGEWALQKLLRQMVKAGCQTVVIEVSSEGLAQYRHTGIDFDVAVLTNLTPEHLEAHGTFERYRHAKSQLFGQIIKGGDKHLHGHHTPKVTVVNLDDPSAEYFLKFWAEEHHGVTLNDNSPRPLKRTDKLTVWQGTDLQLNGHGSQFIVAGHRLTLHLPGRVNIMNALQAVAVARTLEIDWSAITHGLASVTSIPGRYEEVPTNKNFRVIIDYALTPAALEQLYQSLSDRGQAGIIGVFGAAGGGRDKWKRPELGKIAAQYCRKIILTTDDPYNENPEKIAQAIMSGISDNEKHKVEVIIDRRTAIRKALQLTQPGETIAITGMGSETSMMVKGEKTPWNDAAAVREEIGAL